MSNRQQPVIPKRVSVTSGHSENIAADRLRRDLAFAATGLLVIIALIAVFQIGAMPVLDKLLPLVAIIFGFFFGRRSNKH
jgi:hypothetical protein